MRRLGFCDPRSPWQKGTVENTNRRARRWLSRVVNPMSIDASQIKDICTHLNSTPRKCLGYKTPAEVFRQKIMLKIEDINEQRLSVIRGAELAGLSRKQMTRLVKVFRLHGACDTISKKRGKPSNR